AKSKDASVCSKSSAQCQHTPRFRSPRVSRALWSGAGGTTWYSLPSSLALSYERRASFSDSVGSTVGPRPQLPQPIPPATCEPEHFLSLHSHLANWPTLPTGKTGSAVLIGNRFSCTRLS